MGLILGILSAVGTAGQGGLPGPPPPPPPAAAVSGIILGQVIDGTDHRPIPGATVMVSGGQLAFTPGVPMTPGQFAQPTRVLTDSQGRFAFTNLSAGSFSLTAMAAGYQPGTYGQQRPAGASRQVVLLPNQKLGGISIALWKFAAISGTVVDEGGDPVTGATVRAMRRNVSGRIVRFTSSQSARTDDRGIYRLSTLAAGDYIIMLPSSTTTMPAAVVDASQRLAAAGDNGVGTRAFSDQLNASGAPFPNANGIRVGDSYLQQGQFQDVSPIVSERGTLVQPAVYFANAATASGASVVTLASGDEKSNVDFQLNAVVARTVSGMLLGPDGPVPNMGVRLVPANFDEFTSDSGIEVATTVTTEQGQFTFLAVPPGAYVIRALRVPRPVLPAATQAPNGPMSYVMQPRTAASTEPTLFAQMPIVVGEADLSGLSVPVRNGPRLSGRVEFDGAPSNSAAPRTQVITVALIPADGRFASGGLMPAIANTDGQFITMSVPPGKYLVNANAPGWILKSAAVNGRDASETPIDLEANDVSGATITLFNRPAQLAGAVHDARGNPDEAATVLLFPADYRSWIDDGMSNRRLRSARATANGRFTIGGLLPGNYLVIAVNDAAAGNSSNPEVIEAIAPLAVRVSLGEAANQTQDLTTVQVPVR